MIIPPIPPENVPNFILAVDKWPIQHVARVTIVIRRSLAIGVSCKVNTIVMRVPYFLNETSTIVTLTRYPWINQSRGANVNQSMNRYEYYMIIYEYYMIIYEYYMIMYEYYILGIGIYQVLLLK